MFADRRTNRVDQLDSRDIVALRHRLKRQRRIDTARRVRARSRPVLPDARSLDRQLDELIDDPAA